VARLAEKVWVDVGLDASYATDLEMTTQVDYMDVFDWLSTLAVAMRKDLHVEAPQPSSQR
jgi:hypothetical protein